MLQIQFEGDYCRLDDLKYFKLFNMLILNIPRHWDWFKFRNTIFWHTIMFSSFILLEWGFVEWCEISYFLLIENQTFHWFLNKFWYETWQTVLFHVASSSFLTIHFILFELCCQNLMSRLIFYNLSYETKKHSTKCLLSF